MAFTLSSGSKLPLASVSPICLAMESPTLWWSPVSIIIFFIPIFFNRAKVAAALFLGTSITLNNPISAWSYPTNITVCPSSCNRFMWFWVSAVIWIPSSSISCAFPIKIYPPLYCAFTPFPWMACILVERCLLSTPKFTVMSLVTAFANGWLLKLSTSTTNSKNSYLSNPFIGRAFVNLGLPSVRVPVLSKAIVLRLPKSSRVRPPFMSTPFLAALAMALKTALGVEIAKAQGLEATNTLMALYRLSFMVSSISKWAKHNATTKIITAGTNHFSNFLVSSWVGDFFVSTSLTIFTNREMVVSIFNFKTLISNMASPLIVPV